MALIRYIKPYASPVDRIHHLRGKGLVVRHPNVAAKKIEIIGYERLRIYFRSRRQSGIPGRPFIPGTTYQDIIRLYECDSAIRDVCFSAVGQFELLLRNAISEALSHGHGSHPYNDVTAFKDATANLDALQTFATIYRKSRDQRAKHYRETYGDPILPPIWTMKEFLTFGAASRVYGCLNGPMRTAIAAQFGVSKDIVFTSWIECLVDLRNICAHHDRLFNRAFQKQPKTLVSAGLPLATASKLKAALECLDYMLTKRGATANVVTKVGKIVTQCTAIIPSEAGY